MLNRTTLARPYARAAFQVASQASASALWSRNLELAAAVVSNPDVHQLIGDPRVGREQVLALFAGVGADRFDASFNNFLKVLATYDRLELLPEIAAQFEQLRREAEQRIRVEVSSAMAMDDAETAALKARLKARFAREVDLEIRVDESLIGGAIIRAGDQVIDGSVRGRLEKLGRQLSR
jgi:F-type H+-transporting ATPase subunit delta